MKLYDGGRAPNPRRVSLFLAEKGIAVETVPVDMGKLEHKSDTVARRNPLQRLPVLELDDGTVLTETIAICRYFEELHPEPPLMGVGALDKAIVEMWQRRVELHFFMAVAAAFRHLHPAMKGWEEPQIAEWGEANKPKALAFLPLLDVQLEKQPFVAGERFSVADITAHVTVSFMRLARIPLPDGIPNIRRWFAEVSERPAFKANPV